jgi:predicted glycosyltransferase
MRLLIYSQDSMGLGHLRRTHNIAQELLTNEPDSSILVVADSPATPFFPACRGMDYLKLPTIVKTGRTSWQSSTLPVEIREAVALRAKLIAQTCTEFEPDAVLVDHMPVGALGELKLLLDQAKARASRPRLFLGLRDILDAPEVVNETWSELGAYEYLHYYDRVLVYGVREIYDVESAYQLGPFAERLVYCHYVGPRSELPPHNVSPEPSVLVMGGGGADAFPVAHAFLQALPLVLRQIRLNGLVLTGPHMPRSDREALSVQAEGLPVEVRPQVDDATHLLRGASGVVTMGGYNSLCEVLPLAEEGAGYPTVGTERRAADPQPAVRRPRPRPDGRSRKSDA